MYEGCYLWTLNNFKWLFPTTKIARKSHIKTAVPNCLLPPKSILCHKYISLINEKELTFPLNGSFQNMNIIHNWKVLKTQSILSTFFNWVTTPLNYAYLSVSVLNICLEFFCLLNDTFLLSLIQNFLYIWQCQLSTSKNGDIKSLTFY